MGGRLPLKHVPNVVKRVIDTRWSAHYEAVKALCQGFHDVVSAVTELRVGYRYILNELCNQKKILIHEDKLVAY